MDMSTIIVAEKPSVARDIARVLGAGVKRDGYLETSDGKRIVTWALGHLVRYAEPDDYGDAWSGKWGFHQLPMIPETWLLTVPKETAQQFETVRRLINGAERVICATDAGREGEHIFRLIYARAGCTAPVERLWVSSLTQEALKAGFQNLLPGRTFDALAESARARAQADWLVGMNLTRAYTVRHGTLCSVGRVQTPTLCLVVQRDRQIEDFTPSPYFEVVAHVEPGFDAVYGRMGEPDEKGKRRWVRRIDKRQDADAIVKSAWKQAPFALRQPFDSAQDQGEERSGVVDQVDTRRVRHAPPGLYDLTTLQGEANERFGWSAAETLEVAQELYEGKAITYPRTESRHLPEDMRPLLRDLLAGLRSPYAGPALEYLAKGGGKVPGKAYIDNARLTDHHAIIPTRETPALSPDSRQSLLYGLIVSRFVSIFYPDQVVDETAVRLDLSGHVFLASGRRQVEAGWRVVEPPRRGGGDAATAGELPNLRKGQHVVVNALEVLEKQTSPPKRYTDSTLLAAMTNAGRVLEDAEQAEALKESGGLGTPATRAGVIEALLNRGYVVRKGKTVLSTAKGRAVVGAVAEPLRSPELTATWERQLKEIEDGKGSAAGFLDAIGGFVGELVPQARASSVKVPAGNGEGKPIGPCPSCGKGVVERGKVFGCSGWRETGCAFKVWKVMSGKKLTASQVKALLTKGHTAPIKGFKSKAGKPFTAALKLDDQNGVVFDFGDQECR